MASDLIHIPCPRPECGSSDAYCLYADGHGHCYSCGYHHSGKADIDLEFTYEYLPWRGVSKDTMQFYDVKTKIDASGKPISLGYPYQAGECKVRTIGAKEFYIHGQTRPGLFGLDKFSPGVNKYCSITEGEHDALSLHQALGGGPVFSVHSSSSAERDVAACRSELNAYERIYLAFDGDSPGREAAQRVARLFEYGKVYQVKFDARRKDANEYVSRGESEELKKLWWNSKLYLPDTIVSSFADFNDIMIGQQQAGVPYPFPKLNDMTYGLRTGETVLITAQEGVGKTELMHAIEYKLLTETDYNVGSIFLEEPKRRHLQALAGIHLQKPVHLPDCDLSNQEILDAVRDIVKEDDRLHLYSHFGSDNPDILLDSIRFLVTARNCRFILFDHISLVVSGNSEADERRQLDYLATKLEMMVKELDFGLVMVSHVNDFGQTRGSRWPSKMADIKIHLDRDIDSGSNVVSLKITKPSRLTGRSGYVGSYAFDPQKRCYSEISETEDGHNNLQRLAANDNSPRKQESCRLAA